MPTIQKRGDTYRIRVSAGYDAAGKQIMKSTTWKPAPGMTPKQIQKELDRQAAVSYTHLDVYKRQVSNNVPLPLRVFSPMAVK